MRKEAFVVVVAAGRRHGALGARRARWRTKAITVPLVPLAVGAVGMLVSAYVAGEDGLLVSFALTAFGVLLWRSSTGTQGRAARRRRGGLRRGLRAVPRRLRRSCSPRPTARCRVIVFIVVTVASDVGGYAAGVLFGRHPMAPSISPKKSWEGFAGSSSLCMVVGAATVHFLLHGIRAGGRWSSAPRPPSTATLGDLASR